jgi:uncharacterized protein DUF4235
MLKLVFLPFSVAGAWIARLLGRRIFAAAWGLVDRDEPPQADQRRVSIGKLALALALDGAVFRVVRGLVDHAARESFLRLTGRWPGEEAPAEK